MRASRRTITRWTRSAHFVRARSRSFPGSAPRAAASRPTAYSDLSVLQDAAADVQQMRVHVGSGRRSISSAMCRATNELDDGGPHTPIAMETGVLRDSVRGDPKDAALRRAERAARRLLHDVVPGHARGEQILLLTALHGVKGAPDAIYGFASTLTSFVARDVPCDHDDAAAASIADEGGEERQPVLGEGIRSPPTGVRVPLLEGHARTRATRRCGEAGIQTQIGRAGVDHAVHGVAAAHRRNAGASRAAAPRALRADMRAVAQRLHSHAPRAGSRGNSR